MNGSLANFSSAGALRIISSTGKTGAVRFSGEGGCTVYLHSGQLYFARDEHTESRLAAALVRPGRLTAEQWTAAVTEAGDRPIVGELLVGKDAIERDLLASVVLSVMYDPLIRLFRDGGGAFAFQPDVVHWLGPFHPFNADAIADEVGRRIAEVDEMKAEVPTMQAWVCARRALPGDAAQVTLLRDDWELLMSLNGPRTISALAADTGRGEHSTARVVCRLARAGLVDVVPQAPGSGLDEGEPASETVPTAPCASDHGFGAFAAALRSCDWSSTRPSSQTPALVAASIPVSVTPGLERISGFRNPTAENAAAEDASTAEQVDLPADAAWLENLYSRSTGVVPEHGDTTGQDLDAGFLSETGASGAAKASTLRRLTDALMKR